MTRIQLLPEDLAHKIAAGEVIERPVSVVKELVENSIDAQATNIEIEILDGGKEYIRVSDNGIGIHPDDLEIAFMRHATSKISTVNDLFNVVTLGFRGEALSSIASVSDLTLKTRQHDSPKGYQIRIEDTGQSIIEPVGISPGTTVEVRRLFYNTPARYKFLKTSATERRYIVDFVSNIALAHPHIAFKLVADNKLILQTHGQGELLTTLRAVSNFANVNKMVKLNHQAYFGSILGYLAPPEISRGNRQGQITVLNGRIIKSPLIISAVEKAYQGLLGRRQFPVYVLLISMNPELVDVNVHPTKAEVRFQDEQGVYQEILTACKQGLLSKDLSVSLSEKPKLQVTKQIEQTKLDRQIAVQDLFPWQPATWEKVDALFGLKQPDSVADSVTTKTVEKEEIVVKEEPKPREYVKQLNNPPQNALDIKEGLLTGRIIGQLHQSYILLETANGLWILDQHIVHERILYEELVNSDYQPYIQQILPQTLQFSAKDYQRIIEHLYEFQGLGIDIEPFGGSDFLLRGLPQYLSDKDKFTEADILEILDDIEQNENPREQIAINLACKGAVKAGERLHEAEIRQLLEKLAKTSNPFTCPHGRPIIIKIEEQEILRRFGR